MKTTKFLMTLVATALIATPLAVAAGQGSQRGADNQPPQQRAQVERGQRDMASDRLREQDRLGAAQQDRDRIQDRTHAPDSAGRKENNIYGYELMSEEERNAYQERIRNAENRQEKEQIEAQHRREMQIRAESKGVTIDDDDA